MKTIHCQVSSFFLEARNNVLCLRAAECAQNKERDVCALEKNIVTGAI